VHHSKTGALMTAVGHSRRFERDPATSALLTIGHIAGPH